MHLDNLVQQQANTAEATPLLLLLLSGDKYMEIIKLDSPFGIGATNSDSVYLGLSVN